MAMRKRTSDVRLRKREKFGRKEISERRIDIVNGGFETGDYTGWTVGYDGLSYAVVNTETPPEGLWSSKFWGGDAINQYVWMYQFFASAFPPTKIHFWYKFVRTQYAAAIVKVRDVNYVSLLDTMLSLTPVWTQMALDVTSSPDSPYKVTFQLTQPGAEFHVDGVYFTG